VRAPRGRRRRLFCRRRAGEALPGAAERLAAAEHDTAQNDWAAAWLARTTGLLHNDLDALNRSVHGWESIGARVERAVMLLHLPHRADEGRTELSTLNVLPPAFDEPSIAIAMSSGGSLLSPTSR
jgi:glutaminase